VAKIFDSGGNGIAVFIADKRIAEDQQSGGEDLLQGGEILFFGQEDRVGQHEQIFEEVFQIFLEAVPIRSLKLVAEDFLVLFQGDKALHEDPSSFFLGRKCRERGKGTLGRRFDIWSEGRRLFIFSLGIRCQGFDIRCQRADANLLPFLTIGLALGQSSQAIDVGFDMVTEIVGYHRVGHMLRAIALEIENSPGQSLTAQGGGFDDRS